MTHIEVKQLSMAEGLSIMYDLIDDEELKQLYAVEVRRGLGNAVTLN